MLNVRKVNYSHEEAIKKRCREGLPKALIVATSSQHTESNKEVAIEKRAVQREFELQIRSIEETNITLAEMLRNQKQNKFALEEQIKVIIKKLILPHIDSLKQMELKRGQITQVEIIKEHLQDLLSLFSQNLNPQHIILTPREIQIAGLIRERKTGKGIADILDISLTTVNFHKANIRFKLGIKNKKANLRSYLRSIL